MNYAGRETRNKRELRPRVIFSLRFRNIAYTCTLTASFALSVHQYNSFRAVLISRTFSQSWEKAVVCVCLSNTFVCVCILWGI